MDPALFDQLQSTLQTQGPDAAIAALCARLREARDYNALFYALLMKERSEAGVSPIPTGPSQDIPEALSGRFLGPGEPPFEDLYVAYDHYLSILSGEDVEGGLAYFRAQADKADPEEVGTYPAEVLVNLLLRLERPAEALAVARKHLANRGGRQLTCPGLAELCQKAGDYRVLAEVAREQGDAVHFLAGLLAGR